MPRKAEVTLDDGTIEWVFVEFDKDEGWIAYGDGLGVIEDLGEFEETSVYAIHSLAAWNGYEVTDISFQD